MTRLIFAVLVGLTVPAAADDLSPWFGGEGQEPFKMAVDPANAGKLADICAGESPDENSAESARKSCVAKETDLELQKVVLVSP